MALMFHYVGSKQELFLFTYDFFSALLDREYYSKMDYSIKDIFERLRTSYLIQIELMKQYPKILDFAKLSARTKSDEINAALEEREKRRKTYEIFDMIDTTKFRADLNIEKCKHISQTRRLIVAVIIMTLFFFSRVGNQWMDRSCEMNNPIIVEFPLRGEWNSPNTPGSKIPSHGTNQLGTRYAYDFIQVDWNSIGYPAYRVSFLQYLFSGVSLNDYYCWGQKVFAPCDGVVVVAEDGYEERPRTNLLSDLSSAYKNAHYFDPEKDDVQSVAGNYIIIEYKENIYAALCHLQTGSIQVSVGQEIKKGDFIGRVGHSGNSFAPHLHFQLMDSCDIATANGLPCAFEKYEIYQDNKWQTVTNSIPTSKDRIRFITSASQDVDGGTSLE